MAMERDTTVATAKTNPSPAAPHSSTSRLTVDSDSDSDAEITLDPALQRAIKVSLSTMNNHNPKNATSRRRRVSAAASITRASRGLGVDDDARIGRRRGWGMRKMCVEQLYRFEEQA